MKPTRAERKHKRWLRKGAKNNWLALSELESGFDSWLEFGYKAGWVGAPVCYTHDGLPTSALEDEDFEESDPCIHIIRCYEDDETKLAVEANHSASLWRASNRGLRGSSHV